VLFILGAVFPVLLILLLVHKACRPSWPRNRSAWL